MNERGQIDSCIIEGPLSLDVALVPKVAKLKGISSNVAGHADLIVAPNIETGNGIYKAMAIFAKAGTAGIILGGKVPISISSRCDTADNIFNSIVLAGYVALCNNESKT
jgi:phosphate butyryltransferase